MAASSPPVAPEPPGRSSAAAVPVRGVEPRTARITSTQLFAGANELQIDHHGAVYRLKQTALGKLILTK